jgi:hypothetical protein
MCPKLDVRSSRSGLNGYIWRLVPGLDVGATAVVRNAISCGAGKIFALALKDGRAYAAGLRIGIRMYASSPSAAGKLLLHIDEPTLVMTLALQGSLLAAGGVNKKVVVYDVYAANAAADAAADAPLVDGAEPWSGCCAALVRHTFEFPAAVRSVSMTAKCGGLLAVGGMGMPPSVFSLASGQLLHELRSDDVYAPHRAARFCLRPKPRRTRAAAQVQGQHPLRLVRREPAGDQRVEGGADLRDQGRRGSLAAGWFPWGRRSRPPPNRPFVCLFT